MKFLICWCWLAATCQIAFGLSRELAGAASHKWYKYDYEYNYQEAILVIVMVIVAVIFEYIWHGVEHFVQDTYYYGRYHEVRKTSKEEGQMERDSHGNIKHKKLHEEHIKRMGGEFMTLGLLAFLIFVVNQTGGFADLAKKIRGERSDGFKHPVTGEDWLHLAEYVHIQLFLAVLLYFILVLSIVRGSIKQMKKWEKLRMRSCSHQQREGTDAAKLVLADPDLRKHVAWRDHFISHMLNWNIDRRELFKMALKHLKIEQDASDASDLEQRFRRAVDQQFSLASYLSLNVEHGVADSIHIHQTSWLGILFLMAIFAILHRHARVGILQLLPWFLGASCILLLFMVVFTKVQRRQLRNECEERNAGVNANTARPVTESTAKKQTPKEEKTCLEKLRTLHQRLSSEVYFIRLLQVNLFLLSYCFARVLVDYSDWKNDETFLRTLLTAAAFTVLFLVLGFTLPSLVPEFLAITALPPFVDPLNLEILFSRLLGDHVDTPDSPEPPSGGYGMVSELATILGVRSEFDQHVSRSDNTGGMEHV